MAAATAARFFFSIMSTLSLALLVIFFMARAAALKVSTVCFTDDAF